MFYRILNIEIIKPYKLLVEFQNGVKKVYDVSKLFNKFKMFDELINNEGLFQSVQVDNGGYGISWNENIDISCNELWDNGMEIKGNTNVYAVCEDSDKYDTNK